MKKMAAAVRKYKNKSLLKISHHPNCGLNTQHVFAVVSHHPNLPYKAMDVLKAETDNLTTCNATMC
jgi:hypothetical protein